YSDAHLSNSSTQPSLILSHNIYYISFISLLAVFDGDLDVGALHWRYYGVTGDSGLGTSAAALLGLLTWSCTATNNQVARQSDFDATTVYFNNVLLCWQLVRFFGSFSWVDVRRYFVLPLFFNPLGVDIEALAITDERRVCGNCLVERNNRR